MELRLNEGSQLLVYFIFFQYMGHIQESAPTVLRSQRGPHRGFTFTNGRNEGQMEVRVNIVM